MCGCSQNRRITSSLPILLTKFFPILFQNNDQRFVVGSWLNIFSAHKFWSCSVIPLAKLLPTIEAKLLSFPILNFWNLLMTKLRFPGVFFAHSESTKFCPAGITNIVKFVLSVCVHRLFRLSCINQTFWSFFVLQIQSLYFSVDLQKFQLHLFSVNFVGNFFIKWIIVPYHDLNYVEVCGFILSENNVFFKIYDPLLFWRFH